MSDWIQRPGRPGSWLLDVTVAAGEELIVFVPNGRQPTVGCFPETGGTGAVYEAIGATEDDCVWQLWSPGLITDASAEKVGACIGYPTYLKFTAATADVRFQASV